jgi:hypothetical protein
MAKNTSVVGGLSIDNDWQAEEDLRTLARASQIKADSKRYKAAMKLAKEQIEALEGLDPVADAKEDKKEGEKDD